MKHNKLILAALAAASLFTVQSCLIAQEEVFPDSSSERLQKFAEETRTTLASAEKGWIMEYYPGADQKLGGYAYHVAFTEDEVTATCELDPEESYKSYYKLTFDNGLVLSFDTYNPALHYFATPSSSEYEAKGGDFEFSVTSVSPEKIGLRGKRSGNHYDLYPYKSELRPTEYMAKAGELGSSMRMATLEGKIDTVAVTGEVDLNNRCLTFHYKNESGEDVSVRAPYMYTADGIRTYEEINVAGATIRDMYYLTENNILTNGSVYFEGKLPEDYTNYADFAGNYTLIMYNGKLQYDVTLTPDGSGYLMSGLNPHFDVALGYDKALGRLTMDVQVVGANGNNTIYLCAWSLGGGGNLTWSTDGGYGMTIGRNLTTGNFVFKDNGKSDMVIDSFILWEVGPSGSVGQFTGWGENQYPYLQTLVRK